MSVLHYLRFIEIDDLDRNLVARSRPGRPKKKSTDIFLKDLDASNVNESIKAAEAIYDEIENKSMFAKYYGHNIIREMDDGAFVMGIIRSTVYDKNRNEMMWKISYPHDDIDEKNCIDSNEVAASIVKAYIHGCGGPNILHQNTLLGKKTRYNKDANNEKYYVPKCSQHNELCIVLTTKKDNANYGRKFLNVDILEMVVSVVILDGTISVK